MKEKWFFPLQKTAEERFDKMYPNSVGRETVFQVVTKDRVIEQHRVFFPDGGDLGDRYVDVLVSMREIGAHRHVLLMYEMKFVASN